MRIISIRGVYVSDARTPYISLHTKQPNQPQRERIYEATDLGQFRGKRLLIDAASFEFWLIEDFLGKQARTALRPCPLVFDQINSPIIYSIHQ